MNRRDLLATVATATVPLAGCTASEYTCGYHPKLDRNNSGTLEWTDLKHCTDEQSASCTAIKDCKRHYGL